MAPRQPRRMVDPDYAGQVKTGIGAKLNGQLTSSNSFKAFQTPMGGGVSDKEYSNLVAQQRANEVGTAPVRDKFNPQVSQNVLDTFGVGVNANKDFEFNPAVFALNFLPVGKVLGPLSKVGGKVIRSLIPAGVRVAGAAGRVSNLARTGAVANRIARQRLASQANQFAAARELGLSEARSTYRAGERTLGTAARDAMYGQSELGYAIKNSGYNFYDNLSSSAGAAARLAREAELRSLARQEAATAAKEIRRRLRAMNTNK